jgi:xylulokinase
VTLGIGIDVGTTNLKVAVVDDAGELVGRAARPLPIAHRAGEAEQDSEMMWRSLVEAVRESVGARGADVAVIGVCSQYSSIVPVDAEARPVAPMLMWQDWRGTDHSLDIMRREESAFMIFVERHGIPPIGGGIALGHLLHYQIDRPEVHARTTAYLEAMDYVTARLTERISASQHTTFMLELCDNRTLGALNYDDDLVMLAGVDPTRLPELVAVDATVGTIAPKVADELGLSSDVRVRAGTNDTAAVAMASGGNAGLAIGTTSVLVDRVEDFRVDLEHQILSMPGPKPDRYLVMAENGLGGRIVERVLVDMLAGNFGQLDATLRATDAGAGGVMTLPWLGGANAPQGNSAARGGFINVSLATTRADLVRATVEGVAHNLGWLKPHVEAFTGTKINDITFMGGAARSEAWAQILADMLGSRISPLVHPELGAARAMALTALGVERPPATTAHHEPDPDRHAFYAARQTQFEAAYAAVLPISEALNHERTSRDGSPAEQ